MTIEEKTTVKKNYMKPELTVIDLLAEEVLGNKCKTTGLGGVPTGSNCTILPTCRLSSNY